MTKDELIKEIEAKIETQNELKNNHFKDPLHYNLCDSYIHQFLWFIEKVKQLKEETRKDSVNNCEHSLNPYNCGDRLNNDCRGCCFYIE